MTSIPIPTDLKPPPRSAYCFMCRYERGDNNTFTVIHVERREQVREELRAEIRARGLDGPACAGGCGDPVVELT